MSPTVQQPKATVQFGTPVDAIPGFSIPPKQFSSHWLTVAAECRSHPNQWVPVRIGHLTLNRHRQVPADIRKGNLGPFRDGTWDAAFRDGQLYIRFVSPAELKAVTENKVA